MLTILLMLMFGIFDVGRVLYTVNTLTSAAREGARTGAVTDCATAASTAQTRAIAVFKPFGGSALTTGQTVVTFQPSGGTVCTGQSIRVAISYPFSWITPLPKLLKWTGSTDTLHITAEYKYEL